jgi:polysaccharide export outer membrane protein
MLLCAAKYPRMAARLRVAAGLAGLALAAAVPLVAQQPPQRPSNVSDQQLQQYVQQQGLGDQIRQRILQSGLTPDQIRARLRSAGYPENLIDQYMSQPTPGQAAPTPTADMLRAVSVLGLGDFVTLGDTLGLSRDSIRLARGDSLLLDSLGLRIGIDSIPTKRDTLGVLRLDSIGVFRLADRLRRPRVFGLDVFRSPTTQFNPASGGPVDPDYRIGPGDELVLILTGEVEQAHQLPVTREGFVVIPAVGQIYVSNLTLEQLHEVLFSRLGRVYSGVRRGAGATIQFQVSVSKVRVNQVYVTGEVARPGAYAVSALGTVMNALYQAGGPTERGDFRGVRVMRSGHLVQTLDLYDYLLRGDIHSDIRLGQGDVIFVPPRSRRVNVQGLVMRPSLYDLAPTENLRELIAMAGGLLPEAYTGHAQIERVLPAAQRRPGGRDRTVLDVDLGSALVPGAAPVQLEPDDRLTIFSVTRGVRNQVVIKGDVWHAGTYQLDSGMTLSQLIADAGGLKPDTYAERAHILRLMADSTRQLIPISLVGIPTKGAPEEVGPGAALRAAGRPGDDGRPAVDPPLQEFDEVTIYSKTDFRPNRQIAIYGSVQHPGVMAFTDSMTVLDAVMMAGGLRDEAYLLEAEISRIPNIAQRGEGQLAAILRVPLDSSFVLDPTSYFQRATGQMGAAGPASGSRTILEPYDNVFIRRLPGFELQRNVVLSGEVKFPGRYTLVHQDERLRDVIQRAGGFTPAAYIEGAQFFRAENRSGRVGIDLPHVMQDASYRDNLVLFPGDSLYVPQYQSVVRVDGGVNSPVSVAYVPGKDARYYVNRAGGFSRLADKGRTYIVQPNGAVVTAGNDVEPGARVVVPEVPPGEEKTNWASILSSVATILTSALTIVLIVQRL